MPTDTALHTTPSDALKGRATEQEARLRAARTVRPYAPDAATRAEHARMRARDREMIPKPLLYAMLGLAVSSLVLVSAARITGRPLEGVPEMRPVVAERALSFVRTDDGKVRVNDEAGEEIALMTGHSAGFVDAYTSALARKRQVMQADLAAPVRVARFDNGHIVVIDPVTDWRVDPRSYGRDSAAAFGTFLTEE